MYRNWANEGGYCLQLQQNEGRRSLLWLTRNGQLVLTKEYEYWESLRARNEAEALAQLGLMEERHVQAA